MNITDFLLARIEEDEKRANYYGMALGTARVLAECAAKRAIVGMHKRLPDPTGDEAGDLCSMCTETGPEAQGYPCWTLGALTAVYKDHPDYQEEWAA